MNKRKKVVVQKCVHILTKIKVGLFQKLCPYWSTKLIRHLDLLHLFLKQFILIFRSYLQQRIFNFFWLICVKDKNEVLYY